MADRVPSACGTNAYRPRDEPSRDRKGVPPAAGAVFAPETLPLPHGRGSERRFLNTLLAKHQVLPDRIPAAVARKETYRISTWLARGTTSVDLFEKTFAKPDAVGRDFHEFVVFNEFQRHFQRHVPRRS